MGRLSNKLRVSLVGLLLGTCGPQAAFAGSIKFFVPRDVTMRHNGSAIHGVIKQIDDDEVVLMLRTGADKSYPLSAVTSIVAKDDSFKFYPAQESFDAFLERSANLRGATIVREPAAAAGSAGPGGQGAAGSGVSDSYARSIGMQPAAKPESGAAGGGFVQSDGFAGASQRPQPLARLESPNIPELDTATVDAMKAEQKAITEKSASSGFALPGGGSIQVTPSSTKPGGSFALPAPGEEVLICSNPKCRKEVPGAKYGQQCPHCGIIWAAQSGAENIAQAAASNTPLPVDPKNPFANAPAAPVNNAAAVPVRRAAHPRDDPRG